MVAQKPPEDVGKRRAALFRATSRFRKTQRLLHHQADPKGSLSRSFVNCYVQNACSLARKTRCAVNRGKSRRYFPVSAARMACRNSRDFIGILVTNRLGPPAASFIHAACASPSSSTTGNVLVRV